MKGGLSWPILVRIVVHWQMNRVISVTPAGIQRNAVFAVYPRLSPSICARINWLPWNMSVRDADGLPWRKLISASLHLLVNAGRDQGAADHQGDEDVLNGTYHADHWPRLTGLCRSPSRTLCYCLSSALCLLSLIGISLDFGLILLFMISSKLTCGKSAANTFKTILFI